MSRHVTRSPRSVGKHSLPAVSVVVSYGFHICLHFLALSIRLSVLHLSLPLASPTVPPPTDTGTPDGDGGEGEGGHGNEAPITGHTLAVVIGMYVTWCFSNLHVDYLMLSVVYTSTKSSPHPSLSPRSVSGLSDSSGGGDMSGGGKRSEAQLWRVLILLCQPHGEPAERHTS